MNAEQILDEAKGLIARPGGWIQDEYAREGSYCASGAINYVGRKHGLIMTKAYQNARHSVFEVFKMMGIQSGIPGWNDYKSRTQDEVVAMFEKARAYAAEHSL